MKRHPFRLAISLIVCAGTLALGESPAVAATQTTVDAMYPIPSFSAGGVYITGTEVADTVTISLDHATDRYVISDPAGITPLWMCVAASPTIVTCPNLAPVIQANLGDGDDRLTGDTSLQTSAPYVYGNAGDDTIKVQNAAQSLLFGGSGSDRLVGGPSGDGLRGGRGRDRLRGNAGGDYIVGGRQADRLVGGQGEDHLLARDHERDKKIRCGGSPGDRARIDRRLDPKPLGCPHIDG